MLIRVGKDFRVNDYFIKHNNIFIETNVSPDFNILKNSGSLIVNNEVKSMIKTAKLVTVAPKAEDFLYVRNRAISSGNVIDHKDGTAELIPINEFYKNFTRYANACRGSNDNGDFFSDEELRRCYKTFIGKAVFVDHDNENVEKARGIILDAVYNPKGKFVELLKAVDKKAYPELARAIEMSYVTSTSMGCRCEYSICSICHHKSRSEEDYCDHIKNYKAAMFNGLPVWEDNYGVEFVEDSFVTIGADPDAKVLERVASRGGKRINKISGNKNIKINNIYNERNQRFYGEQVRSYFDQLNSLSWT